MAVEARHMNHQPSQFLTNRDNFMKSNQGNNVVDFYNTTQMANTGFPYAAKPPESVFPYYQSSANCDWGGSGKSDSGLTCNFTTSVPRKRSRQSVFDEAPKNKFSGFLDQETVSQIHQHQSAEIDRFISLHTEKMRMELEERKKRESRILVSAIEERVVKKLREKEEEIERMGKLNWVLQERVKSLCVENQLWRELAQTNEATVNSLRTNLEQVLANDGNTAAAAEEAESSCGSSGEIEAAAAEEEVYGGAGEEMKVRSCRKCGEREARVLLMPCRHLCLCTICGSTLHTCPLCNSDINASVHVNFS